MLVRVWGATRRAWAQTDLAWRLAVVSGVVGALPVLSATVRAFTSGWVPVGDVAIVAIRARDVFTERPPLLGTWTTASLTTDAHFSHPGPLQFDLLAVPVRLVSGPAGSALGMGVLNTFAVLAIAFLAFRRGGPLLAAAAAAVAAGLTWAMGSSVLAEPWPIHSAMLPFLVFLLLVWCLTCGDIAMLPWTAAVGSLVLQTHLSYGFLVPALATWGIGGLVLALRSRRARAPGCWPALGRRVLRTGALSGLVLLVCWAQPLVEQIGGRGTGNLTYLVRAFSEPAKTLGPDAATRVVAEVLTLPPWFLRPSFRETLRFVRPGGFRLPSSAVATGSLTLLGIVLLWCGRVARRGRDRDSLAAIATAAVGVVIALATAVRAPLGAFGIAQNQFRWLWPIAAFVAFAAIVALTSPLRKVRPSSTPLVGAFTLVAVVLSMLNIPSSEQGSSAPACSTRVAGSLGRQLGALEGWGPFLVRGGSTGFFWPAVMAELRRRDIPFVVDDPVLVRQLGRRRKFRGDNARAMITVVAGKETQRASSDAELVARHELPLDEQRELGELERLLRDHLRNEEGLRLNEQGQVALRRSLLSNLRTDADGVTLDDPGSLLASGRLVELVREDLLDLDERWLPRWDRYAELEQRRTNETVAVVLSPLPA
ncbi:hypothetical protein BH18ACT1_BH18ACT1_09120 [soil metagenome]